MPEMMDVESIRTSTAYGGIGFGAVAALAPQVFTAVYGLGSDPRVRVMTRLWGTRTAVIGAAVLTAESDSEKRRLMVLATAMSAADTAFALTAGPQLSLRSRVLGTLTAGFFAAIGAYALANSK
jgi:hypothetical protein